MKKILSPETLDARQLDDYLHRGWFRVGQTLITCRALAIKKRLCSTVWTRTDLRDYSLKASLRRVVRKVEERFRVTVSPVCLDDEHEALYQRYLTVTDGSRAPTLESFLFDDEPPRDLFDTWEVTVRDGDTLVAFSFFDLGEESLQSLIGVYEPALARYGLGIYTMLREVDFGVETGRRFHYAGYVLIGDPRMDYKLRPGGASILDDRSGRWLPWGALAAGHYTPAVERQRAALERARLRLQEAGVLAVLRVYMLFELPVHIAELASCITQPLFLDCLPPRGDNQRLLILWDVEHEAYSLVHALSIQARTKGEKPEDLELFAEIARHPSHASLDEVIEAALDACRLNPPLLRRQRSPGSWAGGVVLGLGGAGEAAVLLAPAGPPHALPLRAVGAQLPKLRLARGVILGGAVQQPCPRRLGPRLGLEQGARGQRATVVLAQVVRQADPGLAVAGAFPLDKPRALAETAAQIWPRVGRASLAFLRASPSDLRRLEMNIHGHVARACPCCSALLCAACACRPASPAGRRRPASPRRRPSSPRRLASPSWLGVVAGREQHQEQEPRKKTVRRDPRAGQRPARAR